MVPQVTKPVDGPVTSTQVIVSTQKDGDTVYGAYVQTTGVPVYASLAGSVCAVGVIVATVGSVQGVK